MLTSIAILGKPNVGKSTLFNKLTKSRGAIVSNFSGLTKDRNYGIVNLNNKNFLLIDTGGIESEVKNDEINSKISDQAWIAAEEANSVILLLDKTQNLSTSEEAIIKKLRKLNKNFLVVINKNDIKRSGQIEEDISRKGIKEYISISAEHSLGLQQLKKYFDDLNPINSNYQNEETIQKISIIGRPNAGKSTLINKVSDTQRENFY
jgi:GTP-binding protein